MNFSSSATTAASPSGFYFSAFLSSHTKPIAFIKEKMQIIKPTIKAAPRPYESYTDGTMAPLATEPNLETLILIPRAKANSLPLNHTETIAD